MAIRVGRFEYTKLPVRDELHVTLFSSIFTFIRNRINIEDGNYKYIGSRIVDVRGSTVGLLAQQWHSPYILLNILLREIPS